MRRESPRRPAATVASTGTVPVPVHESSIISAMFTSMVPAIAMAFALSHGPAAARGLRLLCLQRTAVMQTVNEFDVNAAITAMNAAVEAEDYAEAARLKKLIADAGAKPSGWPTELVPAWLFDRCEKLGFRYPTPVQAAAFSARPAQDVVLRAATGAGKTLAYLMPLLAVVLAQPLEARGVRTSEAVASAPNLSPTDAMAALAPALITMRSERGSAKSTAESLTLRRGAPLAIIVVPNEALCEQVGGIAYSLLGGYARASRTWEPGARDSLFKFKGPKGSRIVLWAGTTGDSASGSRAADCDLLITTPDGLTSAATATIDALPLGSLAAIILDEADALLDAPGCQWLLRSAPPSCVRFVAGATLTDGVIAAVMQRGLLRAPACLAEGDGSSRTLTEAFVGEAVPKRPTALPPSLIHQVTLAPTEGERLLLLVRMMRSDLRAYERSVKSAAVRSAAAEAFAEEAAERAQAVGPRPRAVVFVADEPAAKEVASALRDALWGDHAIAVLLPETGTEPMLLADRFRRAGDAQQGFKPGVAAGQSASVLVAPLATARGLDFANVTHVYSIGLPPLSAAEYVHVAGRTGRVGQAGQGVVSSIMSGEGELASLRAMAAAELGLDLMRLEDEVGAEALGDEDLSELRRRLEDGFLLLSTEAEPEGDEPDPAAE